jgi:hypothetical protein
MSYVWPQFMEETTWTPGTVLVVPSDVPVIEHYLMVDYSDFHLGQQHAIHNMPASGIVRVPLHEALKGKTPRVWWEPHTQQEAIAALTRMKSLLGRSYHASAGNCEHPVKWAVTGKWESTQVKNIVAGVFLTTGLYALFS